MRVQPKEEPPAISVEEIVRILAMPIANRLGLRPGVDFYDAEPMGEPEERGRRSSGHLFTSEEVPLESRGVPVVEEPEYRISKRSAKSVAEQISGVSVHADETGGYCHLTLIHPQEQVRFKALSWFMCLRQVYSHLGSRRK